VWELSLPKVESKKETQKYVTEFRNYGTATIGSEIFGMKLLGKERGILDKTGTAKNAEKK